MGQVVNLEVKSARHAVEQTVWAMQRDAAAIQQLVNDGASFFKEESVELRRLAYDLLNIAAQVDANMKYGSK